MTMLSSVPLSSEELEELDLFLLGEGEAEGGLLIDEVHGYFTAMVVAHSDQDDSSLLNVVWDERVFSDESEQQRLTELMLRMRDDISALLKAGCPIEPLVIEEEDDGFVSEAYEGWCFGFMFGLASEQTRWDTLPKHEKELVGPIATLALLHDDDDIDMDDNEYEGWVEMLPGSVSGLYAYFNGAAL